MPPIPSPDHHSLWIYRLSMTANNLEVDFLVKVGSEDLRLIQVSDNLDHAKTRQREVAALVMAMDELHLKKGLILTDDGEEDILSEGKTIAVRPVYKWLLEEANVSGS